MMKRIKASKRLFRNQCTHPQKINWIKSKYLIFLFFDSHIQNNNISIYAFLFLSSDIIVNKYILLI